MPRSRGSEMPQRQSPRGPLQLRTSTSSDSDPLHHRSVPDRSPKLGDRDRRSPRGAQSDPVNQRKLGTRIADLESQLGQAQDELKSLKGQLASAEAAKKAAQEQLEKKTKKPTVAESEQIQETNDNNNDNKNNATHENPDDDELKETYVFEVPVEKVTLTPLPNVEISHPSNEDELKSSSLSPAEPENRAFEELSLKDEEITSLKSKLEEKEKELHFLRDENESLKKELNEKMLEMSSVKAKEEENSLELNRITRELEASKNDGVNIKEKLEATEKEKEALENEMKKLRVQTEQWRKAADAAAAVLAGGGVEMNGRRLSERCGSMDKHYGNVFEPAVRGYGSYMGSPGLVDDDSDDVFGHGKRKGSGIKMFGDLWKKKGHK